MKREDGFNIFDTDEEEGVYIVCSKRKSDGKIFLNENRKTYNYQAGINEAERKARDCSEDYVYFLARLDMVFSAERVSPPIVKKFLK